jgi:hypothetical protein
LDLLPVEQTFACAVDDFCVLVERIEYQSPSQWLILIGQALLRLEGAITELERRVPDAPHTWSNDLEKRFELYCRIKDFLGLDDEYWSEADLIAGDGYMTGSLSDDIADIYFELKLGLVACQEDTLDRLEILKSWTSSYRHHWRQHLIDARKQLFEFKTRPTTESEPYRPAKRVHRRRPAG